MKRSFSLLIRKLIVKEAGRSPPPFPFIFFKPVTCVADHNADVIIPKIAQDDQADYEGELVSSSMIFPFLRIELTPYSAL